MLYLGEAMMMNKECSKFLYPVLRKVLRGKRKSMEIRYVPVEGYREKDGNIEYISRKWFTKPFDLDPDQSFWEDSEFYELRKIYDNALEKSLEKQN